MLVSSAAASGFSLFGIDETAGFRKVLPVSRHLCYPFPDTIHFTKSGCAFIPPIGGIQTNCLVWCNFAISPQMPEDLTFAVAAIS